MVLAPFGGADECNGRCGLVSTQQKDQRMEPTLVKVGKYFINLTNLFWAEVTVSSQDATKR
jgi:hypothetical protein